MVFYEIVSDGLMPFYTLSNTQVFDAISNGDYPSKPKSSDEELYDMAKSIDNVEPRNRMPLIEIEKKLLEIQNNTNEDESESIFTSYYYSTSTIRDQILQKQQNKTTIKKNKGTIKYTDVSDVTQKIQYTNPKTPQYSEVSDVTESIKYTNPKSTPNKTYTKKKSKYEFSDKQDDAYQVAPVFKEH